MSKTSRASLALALVMLAGSGYAGGLTELRGMVSSTAFGGKIGLSSIAVTLYNDHSEQVGETVTNEEGLYFFHEVVPGRYVINVVGTSYPVEVFGSGEQDIPPILIQKIK